MRRKMKVGVAVLLAVIMSFAVTGCGNKKAITADDFIKTMEKKDFKTGDATSQFASDLVKSVTIAANDNYQIEFYVLSSESQAKEAFEADKQGFEASKGNGSTEKKLSAGNHSSYSLTSGGQYSYVSRIDDTVLYLSVDAKYKDEIKDILKELGY